MCVSAACRAPVGGACGAVGRERSARDIAASVDDTAASVGDTASPVLTIPPIYRMPPSAFIHGYGYPVQSSVLTHNHEYSVYAPPFFAFKDTLCNHMLSFTPMRCCVLSPVGQFGTSASDESHAVHTAFGLVRCTRFGALMLQISPGYTYTCMNAKTRHLRSQCIVASHLILTHARFHSCWEKRHTGASFVLRRYDWILAHQDKPNAYNKPSPVTRVSRRPLYLSARHAIRFNPVCSSALLVYVFSARHFPRSTHPTQLSHLPAIFFGLNVTRGGTTTILPWQPHEERPLASGWAPRYAGRSTAQAYVFSPPAKVTLGQS